MPVGGDINKLPYAEGLAPFEKRLARQIVFRAGHMPGNMAVRRTMRHRAGGAQVVYGYVLFITWSPNEQHSAIVLRLMRNRTADVMLQGKEETDEYLRKCSSMHCPKIASEGYEDDVSIELPLYHHRRKLVARDS